MARSVDELVAALKGFDRRREIVKAMSKGLRAGFPPVRKEIRRVAVATLPRRGGLGRWVAQIRINLRVKASGRKAGVTMVGGRNAQGGRADMKRIDAGRVRAPSWGHKTTAAWHTMSVTPGFFTQTATDASDWHDHVDRQVDGALNQIRRG